MWWNTNDAIIERHEWSGMYWNYSTVHNDFEQFLALRCFVQTFIQRFSGIDFCCLFCLPDFSSTFHFSLRLCPSTAGYNPPSMPSIVFCLLLSCSRWFLPSLLCRFAMFYLVIPLISSLSLVAILHFCTRWEFRLECFLCRVGKVLLGSQLRRANIFGSGLCVCLHPS